MQNSKKRQEISKKKKLEDLHYYFKAIDIKVDWYWGKQRPIELKRSQITQAAVSGCLFTIPTATDLFLLFLSPELLSRLMLVLLT